MPTPAVVFEEAADKEKAEEKEKRQKADEKKNASAIIDLLKHTFTALEEAKEECMATPLGDAFVASSCDLLLAKARQMIDQAARTLTTGESLPHTVKDARALNAEIVFKTRTYYIVGS